MHTGSSKCSASPSLPMPSMSPRHAGFDISSSASLSSMTLRGHSHGMSYKSALLLSLQEGPNLLCIYYYRDVDAVAIMAEISINLCEPILTNLQLKAEQ